jgi:hypothetical protein|tara:strand:+ start:238 stop:561 length:324 start_codon:yes stop_codon:yes gene_type:complete
VKLKGSKDSSIKQGQKAEIYLGFLASLYFDIIRAYVVNSKAKGEIMEVSLIVKLCGGQLKLAKILGISQPAVSQWNHVPVQHVLTIENMFAINRHDMRPDIYPEEYK